MCVCMCAGLHASLPSVIPPASEELFGVRNLSLIRKGWEDLLETNHRIRDSCCQEQQCTLNHLESIDSIEFFTTIQVQVHRNVLVFLVTTTHKI